MRKGLVSGRKDKENTVYFFSLFLGNTSLFPYKSFTIKVYFSVVVLRYMPRMKQFAENTWG